METRIVKMQQEIKLMGNALHRYEEEFKKIVEGNYIKKITGTETKEVTGDSTQKHTGKYTLDVKDNYDIKINGEETHKFAKKATFSYGDIFKRT